MKSKTILLVLLALSGAPSVHAEKLPTAEKEPKSAIISIAGATTIATSTQKSRKQQDPIVVLMDTLASSIDKISLQIDNLQKQGADTGDAEGLIFDAKLQLHTASLSLSATTTASSTAASSTPQEIKKAKDDIRKRAVDQLKVVYADILNAIKALKKIILLQKQILSDDSDSSYAGSNTPGSSDISASSTPSAASTTPTSQEETQ